MITTAEARQRLRQAVDLVANIPGAFGRPTEEKAGLIGDAVRLAYSTLILATLLDEDKPCEPDFLDELDRHFFRVRTRAPLLQARQKIAELTATIDDLTKGRDRQKGESKASKGPPWRKPGRARTK